MSIATQACTGRHIVADDALYKVLLPGGAYLLCTNLTPRLPVKLKMLAPMSSDRSVRCLGLRTHAFLPDLCINRRPITTDSDTASRFQMPGDTDSSFARYHLSAPDQLQSISIGSRFLIFFSVVPLRMSFAYCCCVMY